MSHSTQEIIQLTRNSFKSIGYREELLVDNYSFADFLSPSYTVRTIQLAGFAQHPPSYKSSGFGIVFANGNYPVIDSFTALGAPHIFVVKPNKNEIHRWKTSKESSQQIATFSIDEFSEVVAKNKSEWGPESILRAKSITSYNQQAQLDFFDRGLLPVLEREVHLKLDSLFKRALYKAIDAQKEFSGKDLSDTEYRDLFRLIFRLVAAKLLADRQHKGDWLDSDVSSILTKVNQFYFQTSNSEPTTLNVDVKQLLWDEIRSGFHLQNLSLEALAYVYENTFVSDKTRKFFGTHATPPEITEYIVQNLPLEVLPPGERIIFEPFAGHSPFLTASLSRLRSLLPLDISIEDRHDYFIKMLRGIEIDSFACEIARYSLILADYPNPNGWKIEEDDAFITPKFSEFLDKANIVLCNPPYGQFSQKERDYYTNLSSTNKAVEAMLRVLRNPPEILGFVLPRSFVDGRMYKDVRRKLAQIYDTISIIALPDNVFQHSESETAIVIASGINERNQLSIHRIFVAKDDYDKFKETGVSTWDNRNIIPKPISDDPIFWEHPLIDNLKKHLINLPRIEDIAEIHRGIEYKSSVLNHVSDVAKPGFAKGLHNVKGGLTAYAILETKFLDLDPDNMRTNAYKYPWHLPKVIANAVRVSRGPWQIMAALDRKGLYCYQNFHGIWTKNRIPPEAITAVLNGLIVNVFLSASKQSKHNRIKDLYAIPVPDFSEDELDSIRVMVDEYQSLIQFSDSPQAQDLIAQINIKILSAYNLPYWLLSELLDYIGHEIHPTMNITFVDQLRIRHGNLVDKKFLVGLTGEEQQELDQINYMLDAAEEKHYAPIKNKLAMIGSSISQKKQEQVV